MVHGFHTQKAYLIFHNIKRKSGFAALVCTVLWGLLLGPVGCGGTHATTEVNSEESSALSKASALPPPATVAVFTDIEGGCFFSNFYSGVYLNSKDNTYVGSVSKIVEMGKQQAASHVIVDDQTTEADFNQLNFQSLKSVRVWSWKPWLNQALQSISSDDTCVSVHLRDAAEIGTSVLSAVDYLSLSYIGEAAALDILNRLSKAGGGSVRGLSLNRGLFLKDFRFLSGLSKLNYLDVTVEKSKGVKPSKGRLHSGVNILVLRWHTNSNPLYFASRFSAIHMLTVTQGAKSNKRTRCKSHKPFKKLTYFKTDLSVHSSCKKAMPKLHMVAFLKEPSEGIFRHPWERSTGDVLVLPDAASYLKYQIEHARDLYLTWWEEDKFLQKSILPKRAILADAIVAYPGRDSGCVSGYGITVLPQHGFPEYVGVMNGACVLSSKQYTKMRKIPLASAQMLVIEDLIVQSAGENKGLCK